MSPEQDHLEEQTQNQDAQLLKLRVDNFLEIYANFAESGYSAWDVFIVLSESKQGDSGNLREEKVRVVLSPHNAVALRNLLDATVAGWKRDFGEQFKNVMDTVDDQEEE